MNKPTLIKLNTKYFGLMKNGTYKETGKRYGEVLTFEQLKKLNGLGVC